MPAAFNQSIYLMVGVPYASLAVVGWLIRRGCKKNAEYFKALHGSEPPKSLQP